MESVEGAMTQETFLKRFRLGRPVLCEQYHKGEEIWVKGHVIHVGRTYVDVRYVHPAFPHELREMSVHYSAAKYLRVRSAPGTRAEFPARCRKTGSE
jgi:hypothetical protein